MKVLTNPLCWVTGIVLLACLFILTAYSPPPKLASSVVRVDLASGGHGSGVYIGNGIVLTAAHVTKGQKVVTLKLDDDTVLSADVLWINEDYDVAALRPISPNKMASSTLSCRPPVRGDIVVTAGSPGREDDLYIPGTIVGNERKSAPWRSVVIAAMPATGGISGGAVFDQSDNVVGITVGGMLGVSHRSDDGKYDLSQTGLAYIVPGSAICHLLGRA
jgi:S1-C subfamily serine protease